MIRILRAGFGRDFIILLLVTILLGSALASTLATLTDHAFAGAVRGLIGDFGEYDVIIHIREEARPAATKALRPLLRQRLPKARIKEGITLAGKANLLLSVPERQKSAALYENLSTWLSSLPGYAGITYITEPSVCVNNVHPGVRTSLRRQIEELNGVRFVFSDGRNLVAVLKSSTQAGVVFEEIQKLTSRQRLLEIRYPFGTQMPAPEQTAYEVEQALQHMWGKQAIRDVTVLGHDEETGSFTTALSEMKRFLLGYATRVDIDLNNPGTVMVGDTLELFSQKVSSEPVELRVESVKDNKVRAYVLAGDATPYLQAQASVRALYDKSLLGQAQVHNERQQLLEAIDNSLQLLDQLSVLASDADGALKNAQETLNTFEAALVQLEVVQQQVQQINEELTRKGSVNAGDILISALLSSMIRKVQTSDTTQATDLKNLDVPGMQKRLESMATQLTAMSKVDMSLIAQEIRRVQVNLPQLSDDEIGDSLQLIDRYLEGQVLPGDRLQLLVEPQVDLQQSEALIRSLVDEQEVTIFTTPAAVATPDARATLFSVLSQVRRTIAGLVALALVILALLLDQATLFCAARTLGQRPDIIAAVTGSVLLTGMYVISGAGIPGINMGMVVLAGALAGWICSRIAVRLSPVNAEEIEAGLALGLSIPQVLREIVIPASRPGLLVLLNKRRQVFN